MRDSGSSEISAGGEPGKLRLYEKPDAIEIHRISRNEKRFYNRGQHKGKRGGRGNEAHCG